MSLRRDFIKLSIGAAVAGGMALPALPSFAQTVNLLNVSYDPTRARPSSRVWTPSPTPSR